MKTIDELVDTKPNPEVDDFRAALYMVSEQACTTLVETRLWYLAIWVARLREHYVKVGRDLGNPEMRDLLESLDRNGGLGLRVHDRIRKVLGVAPY